MKTKTFILEEIAKHNTQEDCWIIHDDSVYNITKYLEFHPGGYQMIVPYAGKDITKAYYKFGHSNNADNILDKYFIGIVED